MADFEALLLPSVVAVSIIVSSIFNVVILSKSKKSQINNNRPWIISHTLPNEDSSIEIDTINKLIRFRFINSGKSPAQITSIGAYMSSSNKEKDNLFRTDCIEDHYGGIGPNEWGMTEISFEKLTGGLNEKQEILERIDNYQNEKVKELETIFYFGFFIEYTSLLLKGKKLFYKVHFKAVKVSEEDRNEKRITKLRREVVNIDLDTVSA